jgi:hypothetical protein
MLQYASSDRHRDLRRAGAALAGSWTIEGEVQNGYRKREQQSAAEAQDLEDSAGEPKKVKAAKRGLALAERVSKTAPKSTIFRHLLTVTGDLCCF